MTQQRRAGTDTSVPTELLLGLLGYWYPVATAKGIPADKPLALRRLGKDLVATADTRDATGAFLKESFVAITTMVFDDDSWIVENQPDVNQAWADETLLSIDIGPPRVRQLIRTAYQQTDERGRRSGVK